MAKVIKNEGKTVKAWRLGENSEMELKLIKEGKILCNDSNYELFSQESQSGSGEKAQEGDFFKVDNAGFPYPNDAKWFLENHKHIEEDKWEQLPKALLAWEATEEITPEVQFLIDNKGLKIDADNPEQYF